jgi:hypothetical protein
MAKQLHRCFNPYRKVSFQNLEFRLPGVSVRDTIQLRIVPNRDKGLAEIRFWRESDFLDAQKKSLDSHSEMDVSSAFLVSAKMPSSDV